MGSLYYEYMLKKLYYKISGLLSGLENEKVKKCVVREPTPVPYWNSQVETEGRLGHQGLNPRSLACMICALSHEPPMRSTIVLPLLEGISPQNAVIFLNSFVDFFFRHGVIFETNYRSFKKNVRVSG